MTESQKLDLKAEEKGKEAEGYRQKADICQQEMDKLETEKQSWIQQAEKADGEQQQYMQEADQARQKEEAEEERRQKLAAAAHLLDNR